MYKMQAKSSSNGQLYTWLVSSPDFIGTGFPGPGSATEVAIAGIPLLPGADGPQGNTGASGSGTAPTLHDNSHSPVVNYSFAEVLTDSSGNGFTLTNEDGGVMLYSEIYPTIRSLYAISTKRLVYNVTGTALQITGNMTIEMLLRLSDLTPGRWLVTYGGNGSTTATNILYGVGIASGTNGSPTWIQENGSGSSSGGTYTATNVAFPLDICHFAVTRASNVIQFYLNGKPFGAASSALTAPSGGTSSVLRIGNETGSTTCEGVISSLCIIPSALSAAQIKADYNRCLGSVFGMQP